MDSSTLPLSTTTVALVITIFALSISFHYISRVLQRKQAGYGKKKAPEAGGAWPLLGHLHLLGGPKPSHLVLAEMADKYGPIFTIRLGVHRAIVVSSSEVAKECLTTNDRILATRPRTVGSEIMTYNNAMIGMSPYSPYWRQVRKIATLQLLSSHQIELLRYVRESEILASVKGLFERYRTTESSVLIDMKRWFGDITMNVVLRLIVGRRFTDEDEGDEKGRQGLRDFFDLIGRFLVSDGLPFLRWLDLGGYERAMKRTAVELDRLVEGWLEEHKRRRRELSEEAGVAEQDFMDVMLSIVKDHQRMEPYDADTIIKATCMNMILGASDTTTVTLTWALSLLLNHKEALKKAQQELDSHVGQHRPLSESDLKNLPYLNAIIKETIRLYPEGHPAPS
ncbi:hypothetical protein SAY86_028127 [Trapa natans]|uniref:Cytochrome P450 n=1 Tax=Trapa natans TaxID=22666 RepID=A0AAN7MH46_TRANT|nr:hypothetical protein SAY86_028127 [Trapa natans]